MMNKSERERRLLELWPGLVRNTLHDKTIVGGRAMMAFIIVISFASPRRSLAASTRRVLGLGSGGSIALVVAAVTR